MNEDELRKYFQEKAMNTMDCWQAFPCIGEDEFIEMMKELKLIKDE